MKIVMYPTPISKEDKMNDELEVWEADVNILEQHGNTYISPTSQKLIAVEIIFQQFPQLF